MSTVKESASAPRHQHLIVSIFGLYARENGGAVAVSELIRLLERLGVEAAGVRSSVSRLKRRGVLESTRKGQAAAYRLAPSLEEVFLEGDHRIFDQSRARVGDPWILASFSVPESERHLRHRIRSILTKLGCGQVSPGLWIAPDTLADELNRALDRAGLLDYVELFRATHLTLRPARQSVAGWWDLDALAELYREFLERFAPMAARWGLGAEADPIAGAAPGAEAGEAFADYVSLVTEWRRMPYLDPGLPLEYLPEPWSGLEAERLFHALRGRLSDPAREFARAQMTAEA